ncbi:MAG TPA: SGNH/GDSL hydrolase family protein [Thermoanaerobaculia bacterium]|nr:SGNH/GDSL hydrolase family protein [Thermoanaerobaculia bacterium]
MHRLKIFASVLLALLIPAGAAFAQVDTGDADFTRYVAFGDSLTAGFASGALVRTFQVNSYPALIWRQATNGAAGFEQPLISEPGIGSIPGTGVLVLQSLVPGPSIVPTPGTGQPLNLTLDRPYNNIAVPGADVLDLVSRTTDNGGIHDLILRRAGFTQLQQGLSLNPTFVTLWIGNNDVLGAATSGIVSDQTLTPVPVFENAFRQAVAAIASTGAEMAIANIPDVAAIPFVTTVPRVITLPNGQPFTLFGPNGPLGAGDFVLLTASALVQQGFGIPVAAGGRGPLPDSAVLSADEVATIRARTQAFNTIIRSEATARNAAFVDINAVFATIATRGLNVGGVTFTTAFLTGGIFSYDGVHPNAFGYAFIANLFIEAINEQYDAEIPLVNLFPFMFGTAAATSSVTAGLEAEPAGIEVPFVFTDAARRSLLLSLGVPKWIVDGGQPPGRKPNRSRRGGRG